MIQWFRRRFVTGFFVTVPLIISLAALIWIFADMKFNDERTEQMTLRLSTEDDPDTIILDSGTPTTFMAQFLQGYHNLTVITNSLAVFHALQDNPDITLTLTGGQYQRDAQSLAGHGGHLFLREIRADKAFIVAGGVSSAFGVSSKNLPEAEMRRAMISAAREVVVLADHSVLGVDANVRVTSLDRVHTLITDAGALAAHRLEFNQRGIKVMVAGQVLNGTAQRE